MSNKDAPPPVPPRRRSKHGNHSAHASEPPAAYAEWFTSYTKPPAPAPPQKPVEVLRQYRHAFNRFPTLLALHTAMSKRLEQLGALKLQPSTANLPPAGSYDAEPPPFLSFVEILAMKEQQGLPLEDDPIYKLLPASRMHRGKSMQFQSARQRLQRRAKMGTLSMGAAEVNALLWDSSDSDVDDNEANRGTTTERTFRKKRGPRPESLRRIAELFAQQGSDVSNLAAAGVDEKPKSEKLDQEQGTGSAVARTQHKYYDDDNDDDDGDSDSCDRSRGVAAEAVGEDADDDDDDDEDEDVHLRSSFLVRTERHVMDVEPKLLVMPVSGAEDHAPSESPHGTPRGSDCSDHQTQRMCSYEDDIPDDRIGVVCGSDDGAGAGGEASTDADSKDRLLLNRALAAASRRRGSQLSVDEFVSVFGMTREEFQALPDWKQRMMKQERDVF